MKWLDSRSGAGFVQHELRIAFHPKKKGRGEESCRCAVVLRSGSLDRQHQHYLDTGWKGRFSGLTQDLLNHKVWGWPQWSDFTRLLGNSETHWIKRSWRHNSQIQNMKFIWMLNLAGCFKKIIKIKLWCNQEHIYRHLLVIPSSHAHCFRCDNDLVVF